LYLASLLCSFFISFSSNNFWLSTYQASQQAQRPSSRLGHLDKR
jgi:hypothetical protein